MADLVKLADPMGLILCIDDDSNDVLLLQRSLIKGGIDCPLHHASSLQEAEDYLAGENQFADRLQFPLPDVILTDLAFRGGTGIDFLKWFASHPELARIPVLCVTGSEDPRKREEARRFGAPCVSKSANYIEVVNKIRELLICSPGYSS